MWRCGRTGLSTCRRQCGRPAATTSERCGDPGQLDKELNVYNWTDYIDPEIISQFEDECGVKVVYDTFSSNEDLWPSCRPAPPATT
ncbi:MAG: hypothetical protein R2838_14685 [Caldilineaceae bacterium]